MSSVILNVKWGANNIMLSVSTNETVRDVKLKLQAQTHVEAGNQKIMGWMPKGKTPEDNIKISELNLKSPHKLMLVGTPRQALERLAEVETEYREQREIENALEQDRLEQMAVEEEQRARREQERRERYQEEQREREQQWLREQETRRQQFDEHQQRMEVDTEATINLTIACHSIAFATKLQPKADFEFSDKIILPHSVLEDIVQQRLELPLTFRISSIHSTRITHAGVLDFTAPADIAYLPYWMMQKMGLDEGDEIKLDTVKLQKGSFVKLKPVTSNWQDTPSRELLEHQLRNYQSLTTNDVIKIQINGRPYDLRVASVRAVGEKEEDKENNEDKDKEKDENTEENGANENTEERGISITDTDLNVDLEGLKVGESQEELELGEAKEGTVNKGEYVYYTIVLPEYINGAYLIDVKPTSGDPDLYVSSKDRNPTQKSFTWALQQKGEKKLILSSSDPNFAPGRYFIGIHAFQTDAKFSISVSLYEGDEGYVLGGTSTETQTTQSGDLQFCSNCQRQVPAASFQLHSAQCARRNFRCIQCGLVMPVDQKDKHMSVIHGMLKCECGAEFEQDLLKLHKEYECPRRPVKCVFCGLELPYNERFKHQNDCGGRTATCPHCNKIFKRRDMKTHLVESHDIFPGEDEFFL